MFSNTSASGRKARWLTMTLGLAGLALAAQAGAACMKDPSEGVSVQPSHPLDLHQDEHPAAHFAGAGAAERIVGTWRVTYTSGGAPFATGFIQWHSDGTEWENISQPTLGGNICMGSWKALDAAHVYRNHYGWLFTNGIVSGYFNETETDEVAWDGNSYTGTNVTKIYDLSGNFIVAVPGAASATRIEP